MKEVRIYIETSLRGPCIKDGWYAAVVECQTSKGTASMGFVGMERETTYYRTTLIAIIKAMKRIRCQCRVVIYTYCTFIKGMFEQGKPAAWRRTEWKKSTGEEVENRELWQQFFDEVRRGGGEENIEFRFSKHNDYRKIMQEMIAKKRDQAA